MGDGPSRGHLRRKRRKIGRKQEEEQDNIGARKNSPETGIQTNGYDLLCLALLIVEREIQIIFPGSARPKNNFRMIGAGGSFLVYSEAKTVDDIKPGKIRSLTDKLVLKRTRPSQPSRTAGLGEEAARYAAVMAELQILTHPAIEDHENFIGFLGLTWD